MSEYHVGLALFIFIITFIPLRKILDRLSTYIELSYFICFGMLFAFAGILGIIGKFLLNGNEDYGFITSIFLALSSINIMTRFYNLYSQGPKFVGAMLGLGGVYLFGRCYYVIFF